MTGQDGGFRAAAARFKAEVEAALTRARRAADDAKAKSAEFRRGSDELTKQAKTGRLRGVHRGEVAPTDANARAEAERFRTANDLTVEDLPDADKLTARLPDPPAEVRPVTPEDEDFSQHQVLYDLDTSAKPAPTPVAQTSDESIEAGIDSPTAPAPGSREENEDFSQQRILIDATVESYRPDPLPGSVFELPEDRNPS
ncbi:MAG: hypothetical protein ACRDSK_19220 [Actinophytocola sp.]|uniref:hypothetical protein n=1 Tax=Actinophytocola sp. TaxID=1872138 RepID=UPI003D6A2DDB